MKVVWVLGYQLFLLRNLVPNQFRNGFKSMYNRMSKCMADMTREIISQQNRSCKISSINEIAPSLAGVRQVNANHTQYVNYNVIETIVYLQPYIRLFICSLRPLQYYVICILHIFNIFCWFCSIVFMLFVNFNLSNIAISNLIVFLSLFCFNLMFSQLAINVIIYCIIQCNISKEHLHCG